MGYTWNNGAVKWLLDKCKEVFLPKEQFTESYLGWGGKDLVDDISPIDAAMSNLHSANRSELCKSDGITVEYTVDKGITWTDYGDSNESKVNLTSSIGANYALGKLTSKHSNVNVGLRVTLEPQKMEIYTYLRKILLNWTSNGVKDATVTFETATVKDPTTWVVEKTSKIDGWSGWNSYTLNCAFGGYGDHNVNKLRMTFLIGGVSSEYSNTARLLNIMLFGMNYWTYPSTISMTGHLYSYDWKGNATFPADVSAKTFNGKSLDDLGGGKPTIKTDVSVAASAWASGGTSAGSVRTKYAYISISGVTSNSYVQVAFNPDDCDKYNLASVCKSEDGRIVIFAETAPSGTITIPSIAIWP